MRCPIPGRVFGAALGLLLLVSFSACLQLLDGLALLLGLAETRGSRVLGGQGLVKGALPVLRCPFRGLGQARGQALPIEFAVQAIGDDRRSGRGRTAFRLLLQPMARLFGGGIQALLLFLGAQA